MMAKSVWRGAFNRLLHLLARVSPGATTVRPWLHRLRGVKIGRNVFIGDEVYLENECPEAVEIGEGTQISIRAVLIAHTRGPGKITIGPDAFIGPNALLLCSTGKELKIGAGAVIGAGVVVTASVPASLFIANEPPKPVATVGVPLATAARMEDFLKGLTPIRPRKSGRPRPVTSSEGSDERD